MADRGNPWQPSPTEAPGRARPSDRRREALGRLAPEDRGEHPSSGRLATVSDFDEQAQRYLVLIEGGPPSNYSAWSPDLPGCVATGDTLEEVEREMRAAIAFHLEGLAEDGVEIPEPSGPGVYVERNPRAAA
jgi:predicted RNase H-like HicB family nuclease